MKEFWNKLIFRYRQAQTVEKETTNCWMRYSASDEQRKIKNIFFKNFKKDIDKCDFI